MLTELRKKNVLEFTGDQLRSWLAEREIAAYRADQIQKWVYLRQADSFDVMTDISKEIRALLSRHFVIERLEVEMIETSRDGSRKYLYKLSDGKYIESVLIPERDHYTLCISSQVGCAQNCRFCLTARGGFQRNLTKAEIVSQVRDVKNDLQDSMPLSNLVFMGMGEPLNNMDNLLTAISILTDQKGLDMASRRITVSTCGIVPKMHLLGTRTSVNLAVSLHAVDNQTRDLLMPINPVNKQIIPSKSTDLGKWHRV